MVINLKIVLSEETFFEYLKQKVNDQNLNPPPPPYFYDEKGMIRALKEFKMCEEINKKNNLDVQVQYKIMCQVLRQKAWVSENKDIGKIMSSFPEEVTFELVMRDG